MPLDPEFLAFDKASVRLGNSVVFGRMTWSWRRGERWAILGPDGSGKAALVHALLGLMPLVSGEIRGPRGPADDRDLAQEQAIAVVSPDAQRRVVMEETSFYQSRWHSGLEEGQRTVSQFLSQAGVEGLNPYEVGPRRGNRRDFEARRRRYVRWLGLAPLWRRQLAHLSNGELRKTLLVWSLLRAPRLLVLEDVYAGLDTATRRGLDRVVDRLMKAGWPILMVTHRAEEIPRRVTHLLLVDRHGILGQGPRREMLKVWQSRFGLPTRRGRTTPGRSSWGRPRREIGGAPLVELVKVTVMGSRRPILQQITWTVRAGECWLVVGPNGAGKTTLLNLIQGDHPQAYAQQVRLFGRSTESTRSVWEARQQLGWMSPELHQHYPPEWSLVDVVASGFSNSIGLHEPCTRRQRAWARQWLRDLGLGQARASLGELSFGEQRLVLLARAVVKRPRLLILDEACQGLDADQRVKFLGAVDRVVAQTNASLIFVTHRPDERPRAITHELRLVSGRIHRAGPVKRC